MCDYDLLQDGKDAVKLACEKGYKDIEGLLVPQATPEPILVSVQTMGIFITIYFIDVSEYPVAHISDYMYFIPKTFAI